MKHGVHGNIDYSIEIFSASREAVLLFDGPLGGVMAEPMVRLPERPAESKVLVVLPFQDNSVVPRLGVSICILSPISTQIHIANITSFGVCHKSHES